MRKRKTRSSRTTCAGLVSVGAVFLRDAVYMCVSLDAELDCNEIIYSRSIVTEYKSHHVNVRVMFLALLCRSVDGLAREPKKDVPSCDKPWGAAWRL